MCNKKLKTTARIATNTKEIQLTPVKYYRGQKVFFRLTEPVLMD